VLYQSKPWMIYDQSPNDEFTSTRHEVGQEPPPTVSDWAAAPVKSGKRAFADQDQLSQIVLIQCAARTGQRCPSFPPLRLREPGAGPELGHLLSQRRSCLCGCLHTQTANNCIRAGQPHAHERVFLHPWVFHWHLRVRNALRCGQVYCAARSRSRLQSDTLPAKARIQRLSGKRF
jgi:hypothetical protein